MPVSTAQRETQRETQYAENAKFLHATKTSNPNDPIQLAFSIMDEQGTEQILTGEVPSAGDLYQACVENGWIREPRAVSATQRRGRLGVAA
jgi:hypothetical protein